MSVVPEVPSRCDLPRAVCGIDGHDRRHRRLLAPVGPLRLRRGVHLVVLAPHLDDDVCAAGGLIAAVADLGGTVEVLALTDGAGSPPDDCRAAHPSMLGWRRAHRATAYERLGVHAVRSRELGLPTGQVARHETAVAAAIARALDGADPARGRVLAPWRHDGHPDHDTAGRVAAAVCGERGVPLLEYLITAWSGDDPSHVPWGRARQLVLSPLLHARKSRAMAELPGTGSVAAREVVIVGGPAGDGGA